MPPKKQNAGKNIKNKRQRSPNNGGTTSVSSSKKRKVVQQQEQEHNSEIQYEDLSNIDSWDWNEVADSSMITDDLGGFLCLEEIDDVHIEYEGDEQNGKVAKFKVFIFIVFPKSFFLFFGA